MLGIAAFVLPLLLSSPAPGENRVKRNSKSWPRRLLGDFFPAHLASTWERAALLLPTLARHCSKLTGMILDQDTEGCATNTLNF